MPTIRKNQKDLTPAEWTKFKNAINQMHGTQAPAPAYRAFVKVHVQAMTTQVGMTWQVHTMSGMGMIGYNFLAWHRRLLLQFEHQLQLFDPTVFIPYWDSSIDQAIPTALTGSALLNSWSVTRGTFDPTQLPPPVAFTTVQTIQSYRGFQSQLEALHGGLHNAVGGDMGGAGSPADPLFFLHHAFIDKQWAQWETQSNRGADPFLNKVLKPSPMFGIKPATLQSISALGYSYA